MAVALDAQERERAHAIEQAVRAIAGKRTLWPGFAPLEIPLAVYTGPDTYLFRHPSPPEEFTALPGAPPAYVYRGRHPRVTANSSAEIGGVVSATLLADGPRASQRAEVLAAVALHEAFHVHQRARHPGWSANEGDLLLYPVGDPDLLAARRLESEALRRAVQAADSTTATCWARQALVARQGRYARMDSTFVAYERLNELNEGLASYVQMRAFGSLIDSIPTGGFAADAVRARIYATGSAFGALLDRFSPGWSAALERDGGPSPDEVLHAALGHASTARCAMPDVDRRRIVQRAVDDAAAVLTARANRKQEFEERDGWRVVVRTVPGRLLFPRGFDPLNVQLVDGGLLHTRFVELANGTDRLRVIDEGGADLTTFTVGAGPHPLFNGVREAVVAGLSRPHISRVGSRVTIEGTGVVATFTDASVDERGETVIIMLAPTP